MDCGRYGRNEYHNNLFSIKIYVTISSNMWTHGMLLQCKLQKQRRIIRTNRFSGFMSLWTILRLCRYLMALARLNSIELASRSVYLFDEVIASKRSPPWRNRRVFHMWKSTGCKLSTMLKGWCNFIHYQGLRKVHLYRLIYNYVTNRITLTKNVAMSTKTWL